MTPFSLSLLSEPVKEQLRKWEENQKEEEKRQPLLGHFHLRGMIMSLKQGFGELALGHGSENPLICSNLAGTTGGLGPQSYPAGV